MHDLSIAYGTMIMLISEQVAAALSVLPCALIRTQTAKDVAGAAAAGVSVREQFGITVHSAHTQHIQCSISLYHVDSDGDGDL